MDIPSTTPDFSPDKYAAMNVYDLYQVMTTTIAVMQFYNLSCCAQKSGDTAVFEWAEAREEAVSAELSAMAKNLAARLGLGADDEDVRDMAFARIDGYVPSGMWSDGRLLRMKSAAELCKAGA
ncbi:hypothetical protein [Devosia sp. 2618]|uniref:hypothetical protein n=1 Tax=Devosia sp. 2618 TaxID=3156454 RepID=UPI003393CA3D